MERLLLNANRNGYAPDQCGRTMTVGGVGGVPGGLRAGNAGVPLSRRWIHLRGNSGGGL